MDEKIKTQKAKWMVVSTLLFTGQIYGFLSHYSGTGALGVDSAMMLFVFFNNVSGYDGTDIAEALGIIHAVRHSVLYNSIRIEH